MNTTADTIFTLGTAVLMVGLSVTAFSRTDAGDPTTGWSNGAYQRGFEERFERSIPSHDGSVALWAAARWALFNEPAAGAVAGQGGWLFTEEEFTEPAGTRDLAGELARVSSILEKDGMQLVPVIVPDKARMHANRLPRGRSAGFETRYQTALDTIDAARLPVIDLRPALDFDASYMRTDTHWSPEGARRVAALIAESFGDVDIPRVDVETTAIGTRSLDGDLLSFVATGAFRDHVGPAEEAIETFETTVAASGGLFGDAFVPVVLVGTSYSAKSDFHFEGFLKQALQADVLNASLVGQGPFVPMDAYLAGLNELSSPPSIVLWEIPERFLTPRSLLK
ncbi:MAG: hypothetical protein AAF354_08400 [Pseudomonadota bacterium]